MDFNINEVSTAVLALYVAVRDLFLLYRKYRKGVS